MTTEPNELAGLVFSYAIKRMKPVADEARAACTEAMVPGEKHAVKHPITGAVLGFATRTAPVPTARVTDEAALLPWVGDNQPHDLYDDEELAATPEQVLALVREHAPHLLRPVVRINEQGLHGILRRAEKDAGFRPPGVTVTQSTGTTNFYPKDGEAIELMFADRLLSLDGTVRPELTARESE